MAVYRNERDSLGKIPVPANRLWGAQTQRALTHFQISSERMPPPFLAAMAEVKRAAATVNAALGSLEAAKAHAIIAAADEVIAGQHVDEFPLPVWQTGSGTQTNMNMNEVLANRSSELLGGSRGQGRLVHPNDEVNRSQSSNDIIPTAMHVAAARVVHSALWPALRGLRRALAEKATAFTDIVKIGRTHLQDATPLTLEQELSGYIVQVDRAVAQIESTLPGLYELAAGGTAIGTGLNAPAEFGRRVAAELAKRTGLPFINATNRFASIAAHDALVFAHGALKTAAVALMKIANDLRLLGSGPRCGLGELRLPANEPGSPFLTGLSASVLAGAGATALGAVPIAFIPRLSEGVTNLLLSFAAGIMLAATMFSLLLPGLHAGMAALGPIAGALLVIASLASGGLTLWLAHRYTPHEHFCKGCEGGNTRRFARIWLLAIAITIHNFPEGLAVGVGAGLIALSYARGTAFAAAAASGLVEPVGGAVGAFAIALSSALLPGALGFAGGAMLFVISSEVIPETHRPGFERGATAALFTGFSAMFFLTAVLG